MSPTKGNNKATASVIPSVWLCRFAPARAQRDKGESPANEDPRFPEANVNSVEGAARFGHEDRGLSASLLVQVLDRWQRPPQGQTHAKLNV